jgi:NAD(P)H dehydrogenase (quinone)
MNTPVYAVTGASGGLGRLAVEQLKARGVPRRISSRWPARRPKAVSLAASGVQVRQADCSRPATLAATISRLNPCCLSPAAKSATSSVSTPT